MCQIDNVLKNTSENELKIWKVCYRYGFRESRWRSPYYDFWYDAGVKYQHNDFIELDPCPPHVEGGYFHAFLSLEDATEYFMHIRKTLGFNTMEPVIVEGYVPKNTAYYYGITQCFGGIRKSICSIASKAIVLTNVSYQTPQPFLNVKITLNNEDKRFVYFH